MAHVLSTANLARPVLALWSPVFVLLHTSPSVHGSTQYTAVYTSTLHGKYTYMYFPGCPVVCTASPGSAIEIMASHGLSNIIIPRDRDIYRSHMIKKHEFIILMFNLSL